MNNEQQASQKAHYHLVSAEVMFVDHDNDDAMGNIRLNGMMVTPVKEITVRDIGRCQQTLQMLALQKLGLSSEEGVKRIQFIDVYTAGISYLGYMTSEEFQKPPEGMKLQEVEQAAE